MGGKRSMHGSCINCGIVYVAVVHGCLKVRTQYQASCTYQHDIQWCVFLSVYPTALWCCLW